MSVAPLKVLLEMRPALDGFSGIPQETRLVYRGLCELDGVAVEGLVQSGNLVIAPGIPLLSGQADPAFPAAQRIDRLSQVVASLQQHQQGGRLGRVGRLATFGAQALRWAAHGALGLPIKLTAFLPQHFQDFVWRAMFAKSLPSSDLDLVTRRPFRLLAQPWSLAHAVGIASARLGWPIYPRIDTSDIDVFIAETPFPARVSRRTQLVVRYHDSIPLLLPHTIKNMNHHRAAHQGALRRNARDGAWFACVSEATRRDLVALLPEVESRCVTVPNMVSHHFWPDASPPDRVPEVIWARKNRSAPFAGGAPLPEVEPGSPPLQYLLMVGTIEPRKNHATLLEAWELLRTTGHARLQLVLVGSFGWQFEAIARRFAPWLERGGLHLLEGVPSDDLRLLYRHAAVTVCPSVAEGFDFPGVEAMRSGGVVAASDIPVHRDVFDDACDYFSAYSSQDMAAVIARLLAEPDRGDCLRQRGFDVSERYLPARVMPQWQAFLARVRQPAPGP